MGIIAKVEPEGSRKEGAGSSPGQGQEWRPLGTGQEGDNKVKGYTV